MPRTVSAISFVLTAALAGGLLWGCGYSIRKAPPVDTVAIEVIENHTREPRLQDLMYEALSTELMKQGIRLRSGAAHSIHGSLDDLRLKGTAEKSGVTVQYEVIIEGRFFLTGPDGLPKPLRKSGAFIVSFGEEGALELLTAGKELAIRRALAEMSREIAASLIQMR